MIACLYDWKWIKTQPIRQTSYHTPSSLETRVSEGWKLQRRSAEFELELNLNSSPVLVGVVLCWVALRWGFQPSECAQDASVGYPGERGRES